MVPWSTWRCAKSVVSGVNDLHMLGFPHGNLWDSLHRGNQETYGDTSNTWENVDINGIYIYSADRVDGYRFAMNGYIGRVVFCLDGFSTNICPTRGSFLYRDRGPPRLFLP